MDSRIRARAIAFHNSSAFSRRMLDRLNEIEVRPVRFGEDREDVFRFRYRCYRSAGYVPETAARMVNDEHDDAPGAMLFSLWHDGEMVSSIRFNRATSDNRSGMSRKAFPEIVDPMLDAGATIIDPTRFTVLPEATRDLRQLSYVTVRLAAMASIHFEADYAFSLVRASHGAFYRKVFRSELIGEEKECEGIGFPVCLYSSSIRDVFDHVFTLHPFFHSLASERRMLFGPRPEGLRADETRIGGGSRRDADRFVPAMGAGVMASSASGPSWLTVLPTAQLALAA